MFLFVRVEGVELEGNRYLVCEFHDKWRRYDYHRRRSCNVNYIKSSVSSCECVLSADVFLAVLLAVFSTAALYCYYDTGGSSGLKFSAKVLGMCFWSATVKGVTLFWYFSQTSSTFYAKIFWRELFLVSSLRRRDVIGFGSVSWRPFLPEDGSRSVCRTFELLV